jgi:hypothetical protein
VNVNPSDGKHLGLFSMFDILRIDTESDKPFAESSFKPFGLTALIPQCRALGLVAECVKGKFGQIAYGNYKFP